ncbi:Cytidylate kinase [Candidatus Neptunochlamydia vexilliferae]|uniref:Cytidylate kinase n=2 Tax=Candidatus Neptunichlamydia vexilliferae TaxID=1651774 RepID=A0ABS0AX46_9BACT|nr:Cytidylate kinase [Candidatus Neptunochlamydia vexilliferae]
MIMTTITIDGPAGTGKSTVAKRLADALGFTYFDTGALYRAISWQVLTTGISHQDKEALAALLKDFTFEIRMADGSKHYFVGATDVTKAIRTKEVTAIVSEVSALEEVREALKPMQVNFSKETDVVFEGRDLGTIVFPNAHLKFFLTARAEVRAERRFKELQEKFPDQSFSYETILSEIKNRDAFDSSRELAPLKQAEDAILVDTSDITIEEVVEQMETEFHKRAKK